MLSEHFTSLFFQTELIHVVADKLSHSRSKFDLEGWICLQKGLLVHDLGVDLDSMNYGRLLYLLFIVNAKLFCSLNEFVFFCYAF